MLIFSHNCCLTYLLLHTQKKILLTGWLPRCYWLTMMMGWYYSVWRYDYPLSHFPFLFHLVFWYCYFCTASASFAVIFIKEENVIWKLYIFITPTWRAESSKRVAQLNKIKSEKLEIMIDVTFLLFAVSATKLQYPYLVCKFSIACLQKATLTSKKREYNVIYTLTQTHTHIHTLLTLFPIFFTFSSTQEEKFTRKENGVEKLYVFLCVLLFCSFHFSCTFFPSLIFLSFTHSQSNDDRKMKKVRKNVEEV